MNNNSFGQIQSLLSQISIYVSKINEIIFQINNIINSQNQMNQMNEIMQMNMMNFGNNFNPDLNPLLNNQGIQQLNEKVINIVFEYNSKFTNIIAQKYLPINEVINRFLTKIDRAELINNYKDQMFFLHDGSELDYYKIVKEISNNKDQFKIVVIDKNQNITFSG